MEELDTLVAKRGQIKRKLSRLKGALLNFEEDRDVDALEITYNKTLPAWEEYSEIASEIELRDAVNLERHLKKRIEFEQEYAKTISKIKKIINGNQSIPSCSNNSSDQSIEVKLPTLHLPQFNGQYNQWVTFWDTFNSLINENVKLSNIQRFHYLKSCLTGEAANLINLLAVSADNYQNAVDMLQKRYQNKRVIVKAHLDSLLNLPPVTKDSASSLRKLLETVTTNLYALKTMQVPTSSWDIIIVHLITSKLDFQTRKDWEGTALVGELPTLQEILDFLSNRCVMLESVSTNVYSSNGPLKKSFINRQPTARTHNYASNTPYCSLCKGSHPIYYCPTFLKMSPETRYNEIKKLKLCINCLSHHYLSSCMSKNCCKHCKKNHNSLLHRNITVQQPHNVDEQTTSETQIKGPQTVIFNSNDHHNANPLQNPMKLLPTAIVRIKDKHGNFHGCRCLLDSGAESNFVSESLIKKLNLTCAPSNIQISGINQANSKVKRTVHIFLKSNIATFEKEMFCLVVPKVTEKLPQHNLPFSQIQIPNGIQLADPTFYMSNEIDLLIGTDLFWEILSVGQIQLAENQPTWQNTKLGWVVGGCLALHNAIPHTPCNTNNISCNVSVQQLDHNLSRFWEIEDLRIKQRSKEENECEAHFQTTYHRNHEGRFVVSLPFKLTTSNLGDSKEIARKRFLSLEKRLSTNSQLRRAYIDFMNEYESLGHMERIPVVNNTKPTTDEFYLPHHAVVNNNSVSTKLRVVFDGSSKTTSGLSLNDTLMVGPTIQEELVTILSRFRTHKYAFCADIKKMYRQILVSLEDRNFQKILWRNSPSDLMQEFKLNTVTYGTSSAPFLAIRCLQQLAADEQVKFPLESQIILRDFYVDDLLTGADNLGQALEIQNNINTILKKGQFELSKFASNHIQLVPNTRNCLNTDVNFDEKGETKTLGLRWNHKEDTFKYSVNSSRNQSRVTKRIILSQISQIFDPLGLIGPVTIVAKLILQQLWALQIAWDDPVPPQIHSTWDEFSSSLQAVNQIKIPRRIISIDQPSRFEIHGFAYASEAAYGASLYLKSTNNIGEVSVHLICAKSRVTPLKKLTIPRLELCGAQLLCQLAQKIVPTLNLPIKEQHFWTDSTIVLAWIGSESSKWATFVCNRVADIQRLTTLSQWHHVTSKCNPADLISRGTKSCNLMNSEIWFNGPGFLSTTQDYRSSSNIEVNLDQVPERRQKQMAMAVTISQVNLEVLTKFSSFNKLQRVVAYILRFKHNCLNPTIKRSGFLTCQELNTATSKLIKLIQYNEFRQDVHDLVIDKQVKHNSKLLSLNPFLDEDGIIRVGGRLRNAKLSYNSKHPMLLPKGHHITNLLIRETHVRLLHSGPQGTLAALRNKFWIVAGRSAVQKVLRECITCFRVKPRTIEQIMGDLPNHRVEPARPFARCGVDYAGPISIREGRSKGRVKEIKSYIVIFICFSTKAMHIELVKDLTTESFLSALKRFMSRRGLVSHIYSDNSTTFTGANRELKEIYNLLRSDRFAKDIIDKLIIDNITWHFIPPRAPHFGGLWEAGVKRIKYHLKRIMGKALLTFDELYTLLVQIEACINSRPIVPLSNSPDDLTALSPAHFLIGGPLTTPEERSLTEVPMTRLSRWQHIQYMYQHFWKRWSLEYLSHLQTRTKWKKNTNSSPQIGTMVLLRDNQLPPLQWSLGRICEVHPGSDNIVRTITVKTNRGLVKRSINNVCPLPVKDN